MSAMVERVTAAVGDAKSGNWYADADAGSIDLDKLVRVGIEAMREPTEEMIDAGYNALVAEWPDNWSDDGCTPELYEAKIVWPAMVAAALKDSA